MLCGVAMAGLLAIGLGTSAPAAERLRPKVMVVDDVYLPDALTIPKDTKVRFRWSDANVEHPRRHPRGGPEEGQSRRLSVGAEDHRLPLLAPLQEARHLPADLLDPP